MIVVEQKPIPFYQAVCPECKSRIEYKKSEVCGSFITCPVCGVSVWAETVSPVGYGEIDLEDEDA